MSISKENRVKMVAALRAKGAWNKGLHSGNHGNGFKKGVVPWNKGKRGIIPWNKGKTGLQKAWNKGLKRVGTGEKNGMWKGDLVSNVGLHLWVKRMKGNPRKCEHCGVEIENNRKIHWANISGEYKRDTNDFMALCVPCHRKYDSHKISIKL